MGCEFVSDLQQSEDRAKAGRDTAKLEFAIEKALLKAFRSGATDGVDFHGTGRGWDRDIA
jgi:hypothetical protein